MTAADRDTHAALADELHETIAFLTIPQIDALVPSILARDRRVAAQTLRDAADAYWDDPLILREPWLRAWLRDRADTHEQEQPDRRRICP